MSTVEFLRYGRKHETLGFSVAKKVCPMTVVFLHKGGMCDTADQQVENLCHRVCSQTHGVFWPQSFIQTVPIILWLHAKKDGCVSLTCSHCLLGCPRGGRPPRLRTLTVGHAPRVAIALMTIYTSFCIGQHVCSFVVSCDAIS